MRGGREPDSEVAARIVPDLLATRRRIDLLEQEFKRCKETFKSIIGEEWSHERTCIGILDKRISEQAALPGFEAAKLERSRRIGVTLRQAIEALEQITGESAEVEDRAGGAAGVLAEARGVGAKSETTITLEHNGKSVTATSSQMRKALKELDRRKKAGDAPPEPEAE